MTHDSPTNPEEGRGHVFTWLLLPLSLFPTMALLTYDARVFTEFPARPSSNWIGALGDTFAHYGYLLFGLAIWIVPALCAIAGICLVGRRRFRAGRYDRAGRAGRGERLSAPGLRPGGKAAIIHREHAKEDRRMKAAEEKREREKVHW